MACFHDGRLKPSWKGPDSTTVLKDRRGSFDFHDSFRKLCSVSCFYRIFHDGFLKNGRGRVFFHKFFYFFYFWTLPRRFLGKTIVVGTKAGILKIFELNLIFWSVY